MASNCGILRISPGIFVQLFTPGVKAFVVKGDRSLPEGARITNARWNFDRQCIDLLVEHPSLPFVEEGLPIPDLDVHLHSGDEIQTAIRVLGESINDACEQAFATFSIQGF